MEPFKFNNYRQTTNTSFSELKLSKKPSQNSSQVKPQHAVAKKKKKKKKKDDFHGRIFTSWKSIADD